MKAIGLFIIFIFFHQMSLAQGWVSSGGELFQNAKNPWFVKSTSLVKYCIQIEKNHFSADAATVASTLREGFEYWKAEFIRSQSLSSASSFQVATQTFEQVDCTANPDIQFQFGYGTLTAKQIAELKNPSKYIGVTVRTSYEPIQMKASGFVYFSSDSGPHAYNNKGDLIDKAWSRPLILKYAILHELGHIFGIPHMGSGLMSEVFLNQILNKGLVDKYESTPVEPFLRPNSEIESCAVTSAARTWFGVPAGSFCVQVQTGPMGSPWKVFAKKDKDANPEEIGELRSVTPNMADQRGKPVVVLELTEEQKVFTAQEAAFRSFILGPFLIDMGLSATYVPIATKRPAPVYIAITPSSFSIQATVTANRLEPAFIFNSPLSLLLLMDPKP
ncbi:MAG: hypothetical protein ACXWC9_07570 [Pseudobdellovibrionaceae bacterium]